MAAPENIPFQLIDQQMIVVAQINGVSTRMIVDTGAGMELISPSFCKKINCKNHGTYTNERTPGEIVTLDLSTLRNLRLGHHSENNVHVGIYPLLDQLPSEFGEIDGMISLELLSMLPFTTDYKAFSLVLEDQDSLEGRAKSGFQVPIAKEQDGQTLTVSLRVLVNGIRIGKFLVDAGTQHTNVDPSLAPDVSSVALADAPQIFQSDMTVSHQPSLEGGSLGSLFLQEYITTFDIRKGRMIFNRLH